MKILIKILFSLLLSTALPALAIGFGQSHIHSSIGEPLKISVKILSIADYSDENLHFSAAGKDIFKQMKIPYKFDFINLKFTLERDNNDTTLNITSAKAFNEPLAHFVLEMASPEGKQFKEIIGFLELPKN